MLAYSGLVEFTPIYKQCDKDECLACTELACRVNQGKVPYEKVEHLMKRFMELKEESRISKNSPCHFGECDECPDVSCGVWHGLAPEPVMPDLLKEKWNVFWKECEELLRKWPKSEVEWNISPRKSFKIKCKNSLTLEYTDSIISEVQEEVIHFSPLYSLCTVG